MAEAPSSTPVSESAVSVQTIDGFPRQTQPGESGSTKETLEARDRPQQAAWPKLGEFELQERLGKGGMGIVYKSYHPRLQKTVAIKILSDARELSIDDLNRFRGEALLAATLQHAHIVQVFDILQENGTPFIVMEYVNGGSMEKVLAGKPQPPRIAAEWMTTIARGVAYAHEHQIIHRDLKPANILMTSDGVLKITDFGLGKRLDSSQKDTRSGMIIGTPHYMAPEQAAGNQQLIGPPADIHALGAMLYEMLTGRPPYQGVNIVEILEQVMNAEPPSPSRLAARIPKELSTICLKCLSKTPSRRYQTAAELAEDLRRWQDGESIVAKPTGRVERFGRKIRKHPLRSSMVVLSVLFVLAAGSLFLLERDRRYKNEQLLAQELLNQQVEQDAEQMGRLYNESHGALEKVLDQINKDPQLRNAPGIERLRELLRQRYEGLITLLEKDSRHDRLPLARAHDRIAKLYNQAGQTDLALTNFQQSSQIYQELAGAASSPEQALEARRGLGVSLTEQGNLHFDLGRLSESDRLYRVALRELEIAREALKNFPEGTGPGDRSNMVLAVVAEVHHRLGILLQSQSKRQESLKEYVEALTIRQNLQARNLNTNEHQRDLARTLGYLGDVQLEVGQFPEAEQSYWSSHEIRKSLYKKDATAAEDLEAAFQYARSYSNFGAYHLRMGNYSTARHFLALAEEIQETVLQKEPENIDYLVDWASAQVRLVEIGLLQYNKNAKSYGKLSKAHQDLERALKKDPKRVPIQAALAECCLLEALVDFKGKDSAAEVNTNLHRASDLLEQLNRVRPEANYKYQLASVQALRGESSGRAFRKDLGWFVSLKESLDLGFQRKHVKDIENDRAFQYYKSQPEFRKLLKLEPVVAVAAPAAP